MKSFWKYSEHFFQRYIERVGTDKKTLLEINKYLKNRVLETVFHCELYGVKQRIMIGGYKVCVLWDKSRTELIVTTIY
jgi:hypothetical protein